jgi:L-rhamnose mutarotase
VECVAFVMQLVPGNEAEYRPKHDEIWPEMVETLHRFGIRWWRMMQPYMDYNADGTPWSEPIGELFHLA